MVRNVQSMQNLRTGMADLNVDSGPKRQLPPNVFQCIVPTAASSQKLQDLRKKPSLQLFGDDEYTKTLMTRVATGQATEAEQEAFNAVVNNMQKRKSGPSVPDQAQRPKGKEREDLPWTATRDEMTEAAEVLSSITGFEDYQMQLKLLEKQNKKRRAKFKAQNNTGDMSQTSPVSDRRRCFLINQLLARGSPVPDILNKSLADITFDDKTQIEQMWKDYLREQAVKRSHGYATSTAREEVQRFPQATREKASTYTKPFCDFLTDNPTVFHAVAAQKEELLDLGWMPLDERKKWNVQPGGKYFVERNGSSLIAFVVGEKYQPGNGAAILAGHVDALTAKLKPISEVPSKAGYQQLGVAPYAGGLNNTWWDRDLGIAGRVLVKEDDKIVTKLVKLDWPIARIPTLAPHFGAAAQGPFDIETQMVPIVGLEDTDFSATSVQTSDPFSQPPILGGEHAGSFINTQPPALVQAISDALGITNYTTTTIVNWELELFDVQPATVGGLNKEFIYAGRIDDKLCSWSAMQALIHSAGTDTQDSSIMKVVAWFDDEEIGSELRQGARSNFLPQTLERAVCSASRKKKNIANLMGQTYANSFMVSSDVTHAVNPNFLSAYSPQHAPHLNVGLCVCADSNGHMTTDSVSTAILKRCTDKVGASLQLFQARNNGRGGSGGGTVGPMLSSALGMRAVDAGMSQLSMHSIRACTGSLDPGLGVCAFVGFLSGFEEVDNEFKE